jgi:hypothetical protein
LGGHGSEEHHKDRTEHRTFSVHNAAEMSQIGCRNKEYAVNISMSSQPLMSHTLETVEYGEEIIELQ